jgi:hypothetical protein
MSAKLTIEILQQAAKRKRGSLLSVEYINIATKYRWACNLGHEWEAVASPILNLGVWCPYCGGTKKKDTALVIVESAALGFTLLSDRQDYKNNKSKLLWCCKNNHEFSSRTNDILSGYGCPKCAGLNKPDISELQSFALNKGGKLLSTLYINSDTKYEWQCSDNHTWLSSWHNIKSGNYWCPECSSLKTETCCRDIFEQLLSKPFNKVRCIPYTSKYSVLELDGYNEELKIAFEYNGIQHYKYSKWWHNSQQDFKDQQLRDSYKKAWCFVNNIKLIVIPYTENSNLETYITKELQLC